MREELDSGSVYYIIPFWFIMRARRSLQEDSDEEMDLKGPQEEVEEVVVVEMETNDSISMEMGDEGPGDSSSEDPEVPKAVTREDGKTFLNPASLGRAPKPKPHPRYGFSLA